MSSKPVTHTFPNGYGAEIRDCPLPDDPQRQWAITLGNPESLYLLIVLYEGNYHAIAHGTYVVDIEHGVARWLTAEKVDTKLREIAALPAVHPSLLENKFRYSPEVVAGQERARALVAQQRALAPTGSTTSQEG